MAEQNPGQGSAPIITLAKCPRCGWTACTCDLAAEEGTAPARPAVEPITVGTATIDPGSGPFEARGMWAPRTHGRPVFIDTEGKAWAAGLVVSFEPDFLHTRCVHGDTADELCNRLPSDAELAEMREAQSTVTELRERLGRLTPEAVRRAIQVGAWRPEHQQDTMVRRVLALVAEPAPVPDSARAAELIRFHLQRPDISASDRAELAAFADSLDAKPDAARDTDTPPIGPVGPTGHRWPCPRFYTASASTAHCTCGLIAADAPPSDVDPVAHEEHLSYLEPDDGQE